MDANEQTLLELRSALEREVSETQRRAQHDNTQLNEISPLNNEPAIAKNEPAIAQHALAEKNAELLLLNQSLDEAHGRVQQDAENLKASETRYRRLFEAARDGILILDAATGKIEDVNPFLCQFLGYAPDDFLGKQLWEIGTFRDIAANQDALRTLQEKEYIRHDDLSLETKDGQSVSVEFVSNVYVSGDKKVIQCNIRYIRERKSATAVSARLAAIVESSDDAIISKTLDGIITTRNAGAQQLYGYSMQEAVGRPVSFLAPSSLPDEMPQLLEKIRRGEPIQRYETVRTRKDGSRVDISLSISPLRDAQGNIIGASSIKRDITERKRAEAALQKERDFSSAVIDTVGNLVVVLDRQGCVVRFNRACEQLTGYSFAEVQGRDYGGLFLAPEEAGAVKAAFEEICAGQFPSAYENYFITKDGSRRLTAWSNTALLDAAGAVQFVIGTGTDITERKRAEAALRASEERYRALSEAAPDDIFIVSRDGILQYINHKGAQKFGLLPEALIGKSLAQIFPPHVAEHTQDTVGKVFVSAEALYDEARISFQGRDVWLSTWLVPLKNSSGAVHEVMGVARDISEQKHAEMDLQRQAEELARSNAELARFNRLAVGRELRMVELKQRINGLSEQLGSPAPYKLDFLAEEARADKGGGDDDAS